MMREFSPEVIEKLGHYVYLYVDPLTSQVFYVGKGFGNRVFSHLEDPADSSKVRRIQELRRAGIEPQLEILVHGLDTETAYRVEAAVIDLLAKEKLTNRVRGWRSGVYGRMTVDQIEAQYAAPVVEIDVPAILIRINELFRYGMSPIELYDATRGIWRIGSDRTKAKFAIAVFEGVVQEVYEIQGWFPAGSTLSTRGELKDEGRYVCDAEFVATAPIPFQYSQWSQATYDTVEKLCTSAGGSMMLLINSAPPPGSEFPGYRQQPLRG